MNAVKKEKKIDAATSCMCLNRWDIDFVPEAIASSTWSLLKGSEPGRHAQ